MTLLEDAGAMDVRAIAGCDHSGLHSPVAQYSRSEREIRYLTVCDGCGSELRELLREPYEPKFDPAGNDPYLTIPV